MTSIFHSLIQVTQFPSAFSGWRFTLLSEVLVKGTLLLLIAFAVGLVLRRGSAATRHLVWTLALCAVLALPVFTLTLPVWEVPIPAPSSSFNESVKVTPRVTFTASPQGAQSVPTEENRKPAIPAWPGAMLFIWALGSMTLLTRMAVGEIRVRRLAGGSRLFQTSQANSVLNRSLGRLRISRAVELRTSEEIGIPFTRGVFRPEIFLPEAAREWGRERLEFVVAHELAHVSRHDYLTQMPAQVACALFWFHPLVWLAALQMRKERERACDDMVLSLGHPAPEYAEFLLELGRGLRRLTPAWSTNIAMAQSSQLEVRMKALLDPKINHEPVGARRALFVAILMLALLVPAAAIRATARNGTGSISGTVQDPSGAVIPGAAVILLNMKSHDKIEIGTGQDGSFTFPAISAGRYQLEIASPGFVRKRSPVLELKPSGDLHEAITLDVGEVSQTITVTGQRPAEATTAPRHPPKRIRVGGNVQAPKVVEMARPVYPASAKAQGIEGTVILRAVIGTSGQILSLEPYNGADPTLIKAAMDAVGRWRYQPTLLNGVPVEVATTITVVFQLDQ